MTIKAKGFSTGGGGGGGSSDTLNDVTGRGATTANSIQVGGLNIAGAYALPTSDGTANQVLQSDGAGSLSFSTISVTGALNYKGTFNVTTALPDLSNALKGDFYIVQGTATRYGDDWVTGDHLVINEDMGGVISNGKIDKIDNTDLVTSVNSLVGAVVLNGANLDGDHTPVNYSTTTDKIEKHLEGIDTKFGTLGSISTQASNNVTISGGQITGITDIAIADGGTGASTAADARTNLGLGSAATSSTSDFLAVSNNLSDLNSSSTARTNLGLSTVASTGAYSDLSGLPTVPTSLNTLTDVTISSVTNGQVISYNSTSGDWENSTPTSGGATDLNGLSDVTITTAATGNILERAASGQFVNVAKNTIDVSAFNDDNTYQPKDAGLTSISGLTTAANKMIYTTGSDTYAVTDLTSAGRALLDDADASAQRTTLGLGTASTAASTDFQAVDAGLTSISGLTTAANKMIYTTGSDTYAVTDLTSAGRALLDDVDASAQRTTLGLGTASTAASTDFLSGTGADTLGGDLDVGTSDIISSSNNPIELAPDGSGVVTIKGNATGGSGQLKLNCEQNSHGVTIKGPPHSAAATYTLTLPDDDGDAGEVLQSDGSGNLSWVAQSGGGGGYTYSAKTSSFTAITDYHYSCTNAIVATLPSASTSSNKSIRFKNMGSHTVTITPDGSDKIEGLAANYSMTVQYSSLTLFSNGGDGWEII